MANSVIGALRVNLGIDSAAFSDGLKKAQSGLDRFAKQATVAFAAVAASGAAMAGALALGIKNTIDGADDMGKAAQKFGVGVEELSRLKHAADLSGVSFEGLGTGLRKLSQNMQEFAKGAKNASSQAFQALGISVTEADGRLKSSTQVLTEVAAKFAQMEDGAQKTAIAIALFGRSGTDLIPMLNAGADGLREMMQEADALGIVIDTKTARAAEAFNDNLTRLGRAKDGLVTKITAALLPSLELLSEKFLKIVADGEKVEAIAGYITDAFQFIAVGAARVIGGIAGIRAELAGLADATSRLFQGDFAGARDAWNAGQEAAVRIREEMVKASEAIFDGTNISQGGIQRRIDDAFGTAGVSAGERFVANFAAATGGGKKVKDALDPMLREAARVFDQTRTPLENYQAQIARLNAMLAAGAISQDTYNRAVIQAQDAFDKASKGAEKNLFSLKDIGQGIAQTIGSAFQGLIDGSQRVSDVLKNLISQLASMLLNKAFMGIVGALFGGGVSGGGIPWADDIFRAKGGPVKGGRAYIVGERGPELMVPGRSGTVIPNDALSSGGRGGAQQNVAITVNVEGANGDQHVIDLVQQGVSAGLEQYDSNAQKTFNQRKKLAERYPRRNY